jgi:hypothetical protein
MATTCPIRLPCNTRDGRRVTMPILKFAAAIAAGVVALGVAAYAYFLYSPDPTPPHLSRAGADSHDTGRLPTAKLCRVYSRAASRRRATCYRTPWHHNGRRTCPFNLAADVPVRHGRLNACRPDAAQVAPCIFPVTGRQRAACPFARPREHRTSGCPRH